MLKQALSQKLLQKLSPQQIQLMKLLQVPTANLEQRIKEELEANPALDTGIETESSTDEYSNVETSESDDAPNEQEEFDMSEYLMDDEVPDYKTRSNNYSSDDEEKTIPIKVVKSFQEQLKQQLGLVKLNEHERDVATQLIGSIGEDGYMRRDIDAIVDDLAFAQNIMTSAEEIEKLLKVIQRFEPAGVGARSLSECLLLQLRRRLNNMDLNLDEDAVELAIKIIDRYFDEFAKKHYSKLQGSLKVTQEELKAAIDEILKLNPKPGGSVETQNTGVNHYIVPDFTVIHNDEGELELKLNSRNAPDLHVSGNFKEMLESYQNNKNRTKEDKQAVLFIKQKIDAAKWFIDAIKQRQQTLFNTMYAIMEYQSDFFKTGDETELRPMILKDIADTIKMDISTISRVANSKFVETEFGTFSLKHFFSESLTTTSGEEVSTREVKQILQDLVDAESKRKPLSDEKLMQGLKEKGYNIARRTVAKYREQLNIPVARLRKEL